MSGPVNPYGTIGDTIVLSPSVMMQQYKDGRKYQVALKPGAPLELFGLSLLAIPEDLSNAVWSRVHDPRDVEEFEDTNIYLTLWVANE